MTLVKSIGSIRYYTDQYSNGKYTGVKLDGRESFILHPTDKRWVETQSTNKQISKYLFTDEGAATNAVKLAMRKDLNESKEPRITTADSDVYIVIDWDGAQKRVKVTQQAHNEIHVEDANGETLIINSFEDDFNEIKREIQSVEDARAWREKAGARRQGRHYHESKQPPKEAKAYKNGYITGQESSKGDVAGATIPDNYRGTEHEAKWKQGFRDGFKNKPVKESRMIGAKDTAHWTTDEYGKRVPKVGSYWFLNGDGGDDVYVITGVHDGAVYTQNTRTLKTQWTKLKFWEQYATPANSKEDAGLNHAEKQVSRAVKKDVGIERVARQHAEKQIRQDIGEEAAAPASANSVGASKNAGHATAHAPDAVGVKKKVLRRKPKREVKEARGKTDGVKHWQENRPEYYMVYNDGDPIDSTKHKTKEAAQKAAREYHDRAKRGHTIVKVFNKGK